MTANNDIEARVRRREYMRRYRLKNKDKMRAYHKAYLQDSEHYAKHKKSCDKYRKENMTDETREKIRQYQREYYRKRKEKENEEALKNVIS